MFNHFKLLDKKVKEQILLFSKSSEKKKIYLINFKIQEGGIALTQHLQPPRIYSLLLNSKK